MDQFESHEIQVYTPHTFWSLNFQPIYFHFCRTDAANNKIIYSQDFPEKSLNGEYEFKLLLLGSTYFTKGVWNMTLYDYAWVRYWFHTKGNELIHLFVHRQTTSVTRVGKAGGLLKVRVEIDKLGDLKLKISDLFGGRKVIGNYNEFSFIVIRFLLNFPLHFFLIHRNNGRFSDKLYVETRISIRSSINKWLSQYCIYWHF